MPPVFPTALLGAKVEILINGTWTDITIYALQRNNIHISGYGRTDWTSGMQAATCTMTLKNDGRFSPKNTAGAYYPYVTRNVQIRVSVNAQSVTGVAYSGFRFWGEVSSWPPQGDSTGRDVWCDITISGIWRRLSQLQTTLGSSYRRYYVSLTGGSIPQSYWPMEDGSGSSALVPYIGASVGNATWVGKPSLASNSGDFPGSDGIVGLNGSIITATVPASGTATNNCTRFLLSVPVNGDSGSGSTNWNLAEIDSSGTVAKFEVYLNFSGTLGVNIRNSGGTILASGSTTTNVKAKPVIVSCELTPSGGNVAWAMRIITPGAAGITESLTGTLTTATVNKISKVVFNRSATLMDSGVGHLSVTYGAVPSMVTAADAVNGHIGEFAMTRFTRLCSELGIASETIGTASTTATMGPQLDDTLSNVFQMIEDTDCGLLYETRDQFGLGYRSNASMANQAVAVTLSYSGSVIDTGLQPTYDDQLTKNNITITNWDGYVQQSILTAGAMSILNPPNGIGNGYAYTRNVSTSTDGQIAGIATFLLNVGSVDEIRFPVVTVRLSRSQAAAIFSTLPSMNIGDYFQISGPPSYLTSTTIKQLMWGLDETINARTWTLALSSVPETPWETGFSPGTIQTAQIPGGSATFSSAQGQNAPVINNGSITPSMLTNGITIHTLGGSAVTISASAPTSPNVNDIWIASATGLISQWNGSSWAPIKLDASATILAGTIVASNIAAGTITAALLVAGIAVVGIVDATTVQAAQYIATGTQGEFLAYSGTPALGNLNASISGLAGSDAYANPFPVGVMAQALTLQNQGSPPTPMTGADQLYAAGGGRPRFISSSGDNSVLERATVNVATWSVGNTNSPTAISAPMSYLAGEGNQSSEFEIEIIGSLTWPASGFVQWLMQFYIDTLPPGGSGTLSQFTSGTSLSTASGVLGYRIVGTLYFTNGGAGGTAQIGLSGVVWETANPRNATTGEVVGANTGNFSLDATVNHTFQLAAWNSSTSTGSTFATARTKLTRRM